MSECLQDILLEGILMSASHTWKIKSLVLGVLLSACDGSTNLDPGSGSGPQSFEVSVEGLGEGTVRLEQGSFECQKGSCAIANPERARVTLTATAASGSTFTGWSGDCTGSGSCELDLSVPRQVRAVFSLSGLRSVTVGTAGRDSVRGLTVDADGNVTMAVWSIEGGSVEGHSVPAGYFLAQYSSTGTLRWLRSLPAGLTGVAGLAADATGRVLVAGTFSGTLDAGTGGALTSAGATDVLLLLLALDGSPVWARRYGGTSADTARALAIAPGGDILLAGDTGNTGIDFGKGPVGVTSRGFMARLSADGAPLWAQPIAGIQAFASDSRGRILLTGHTDSFSGGFYVICLDANGADLWSSGPADGSSGYSAGVALAVDATDSVYVAGYFSGVFRGVPEQGRGAEDAFLLKLSPEGQPVWGKLLGGTDSDFAAALALDSAGNPVVAGRSRSPSLDLGGGDLMSVPQRGQQLFVARFAPEGTHRWSRAVGNEGEDAAYLLAHRPGGPVWVAGTFEKSIHFGDAPRQSVGAQDAFILALP
jgi:hypothetical protein